jgi:hypothetical protein
MEPAAAPSGRRVPGRSTKHAGRHDNRATSQRRVLVEELVKELVPHSQLRVARLVVADNDRNDEFNTDTLLSYMISIEL